MGDLDTKLYVRNKDGAFVEYKEPYATIECETEEDLNQLTEAMRQYKGWIPVEEKLPAAGEYILISFSNFSLVQIGRYEEAVDGDGAFYIGDEAETCLSQDLVVNAWMGLPKPYRQDEREEK